jgi:hypothetical protein
VIRIESQIHLLTVLIDNPSFKVWVRLQSSVYLNDILILDFKWVSCKCSSQCLHLTNQSKSYRFSEVTHTLLFNVLS